MLRTLAEARRLDVSPDRLQVLGRGERVERTPAVQRCGMADHRRPAAILRESPPTFSPPRTPEEVRLRGAIGGASDSPGRNTAIRTRAALARHLRRGLDLRERLHRGAQG